MKLLSWEQRKFENIFDYERPDKYIVESDEYNDYLIDDVEITRSKNGAWRVKFADKAKGLNGTAAATTTYGTPDVKFDRLLQHAFNHTTPNITKKDLDGKTYKDEAAIKKADAEFAAWQKELEKKHEEKIIFEIDDTPLDSSEYENMTPEELDEAIRKLDAEIMAEREQKLPKAGD